ncbi:MAG: hypothetical protein RIR39_1966 [Pseudomonadota bacterium]|jgi:hypothetical protein
MNNKEATNPPQVGGSVFDLADSVIEEVYPNFYNKERGWWGDQRIPNHGILRGAIAKAILLERERSSVLVSW